MRPRAQRRRAGGRRLLAPGSKNIAAVGPRRAAPRRPRGRARGRCLRTRGWVAPVGRAERSGAIVALCCAVWRRAARCQRGAVPARCGGGAHAGTRCFSDWSYRWRCFESNLYVGRNVISPSSKPLNTFPAAICCRSWSLPRSTARIESQ
eukprot:3322669-Prymnesium_polylepis.3